MSNDRFVAKPNDIIQYDTLEETEEAARKVYEEYGWPDDESE